MDEIEIVGQVIGGKIGDIVIREKSGKNLKTIFFLLIIFSSKVL